MSLINPNLVTLTDTGADCSWLKPTHANSDKFINVDIKHQLKGITKETLKILDVCHSKIFISD